MTADLPRVVLDANIMVSSLLGRSFPLLPRLLEQGVELFAPVQQLAETRKILAARSSLGIAWVDEQMGRLLVLVRPLHPALIQPYEDVARSRLHDRGQPDWPVLAASLAMDAGVWSHDKDFFGSGAAVWSTWVVRGALARAERAAT